jgi:hypothetical protein
LAPPLARPASQFVAAFAPRLANRQRDPLAVFLCGAAQGRGNSSFERVLFRQYNNNAHKLKAISR